MFCGRQPGRLGQAPTLAAPTAVTLATLMVAAALWATVRLIDDLIHGSAVTNDPARLPRRRCHGVARQQPVLLTAVLADRQRRPEHACAAAASRLRVTQHMSPELAPYGWRPVFLDYLHLGFTNATAFSPTDVMPLTHRAKHNARAIDGCPRVTRSHRGPSRKRLHLTRTECVAECFDNLSQLIALGRPASGLAVGRSPMPVLAAVHMGRPELGAYIGQDQSEPTALTP